MKIGALNISTFETLQDIWLTNKGDMHDHQWMKASGLAPARLCELKTLLKNRNNPKPIKVGRSCTPEKISSLLQGLITIFGGEFVKAELLKKLEKTEGDTERLLLLCMLIDKTEDKEKLITIMKGMVLAADYQK